MSETSPLHDVVFVLRWQVHLVVVSLFAVLGVWWGMTRRPWYVGPILLLGLLLLFLPLEAPEPATVLLFATPTLAMACRAVRWFLEPRPPQFETGDSPAGSSWRLPLSDAFWLTFVFGLLCALVTQLGRLPWRDYEDPTGSPGLHWSDLLLNTVCLCAIAVAVLVTSRQKTWVRQALGAAATLVLVILATSLHQAFVRKGWLLISDWSALLVNLSDSGWTSVGRPNAHDIFVVYLLSFLEFVVILAVGVMFVLPPATSRSRWLRIAVNAVAGCGFLAISVGLGDVYLEILNRPTWPAEEWPVTNRREELRSIAARHDAVNPQSLSLNDLRAANGDAAAKSVAALFDELNEVLHGDNITPFDSRSDKAVLASLYNRGQLRQIRDLVRALNAQSDADWGAGRRAESLRSDVLCLRLAERMQRRATSIEFLFGVALENMAIHRLNGVRADLTCDETRFLTLQFQHMADTREPLGLLIQRNAVYDEEALGWRERLLAAARRLLGKSDGFDQALQAARDRRDALLVLLQTDLALRCYRQTHGRWPGDLQRLVPAHLRALPIDPYSDLALVYRLKDNNFVLYTLGQDGVDDGGTFGRIEEMSSKTTEVDLDLDTWLRQAP